MNEGTLKKWDFFVHAIADPTLVGTGGKWCDYIIDTTIVKIEWKGEMPRARRYVRTALLNAVTMDCLKCG